MNYFLSSFSFQIAMSHARGSYSEFRYLDQLSVDLINICSTRVSNPQHLAQKSNRHCANYVPKKLEYFIFGSCLSHIDEGALPAYSPKFWRRQKSLQPIKIIKTALIRARTSA